MVTDNTLEITLDTWIISDTHFFHENIGRYCSRPDNWQELVIKNWNDLVSPDETILHLGDFALGNKSNFDLLTGMLRGRLFLIQGNHDRISKSYCETRGVTLVKNSLNVEISDQMKLIFSHRPIVPLEDGWINLHGHIHNVPPPPEGSNLGPNHINMSVEVREYRPWRLGDILKTIKDHPTENDVSLR
jgi:calcineurin-like phosphoesterase family protein